MKILTSLIPVLVSLFLMSCTKEVLPGIDTLPVTSLKPTQVTLNGNVTNDGNCPVTSRGFCWSLLPDPTLSDSSSVNGSGAGMFYQTIEVMPDTIFYIRAYATNSVGTSYGNQVIVKVPGFPGGTFTDERDSRIYRWVTIGTQTWMAENLAYIPSVFPPSEGGYTEPFYYVQGYEGHAVSEAVALETYMKYGVLFNWKASQYACPAGWRIPTDDNWKDLEEYLGMDPSVLDETGLRFSGAVGEKMKSAKGWAEAGNGSDSFGFNALPAGGRNKAGEFGGIGTSASFWTASPAGSSVDFYRGLSFESTGINRGSASHNVGLSIRCIRN